MSNIAFIGLGNMGGPMAPISSRRAMPSSASISSRLARSGRRRRRADRRERSEAVARADIVDHHAAGGQAGARVWSEIVGAAKKARC